MKTVILHLGGSIDRALHCIDLANRYSDAIVLVSSESNDVLKFYTDRGIDSSRVFVDMNAWDTVTNFTTTYTRIVNEFKAHRIFVVTHRFHMRRSMEIAKAVYWNSGIEIIESSAGGADYKESASLILGDMLRSWIWRFSGILFYWKSVRKERSGMGYPPKWNEIGL